MKESDTKPSKGATWYDAIRAEHKLIRAMITNIVSELDRLRERHARPDEHWEMPDMLASLRDHLKRHFELEETGGLLGDAVQYYDEAMQKQVWELIADHRAFERRLDRILLEIDIGFVPPQSVQRAFDGEFRLLVRELASHETIEDGLLRRLVSQTRR